MAVDGFSDSESEEDEEEKLPAVLKHSDAYHASDDESEDDDMDEDSQGDDDESELSDPQPPGMSPPPSQAAVAAAATTTAAAARPVAAVPRVPAPAFPGAGAAASMAPVSMNQVLADTRQAPKRRRGKGGKKTRGKSKGGKGKLPADVSRMLGEANMCYVSQDFQAAIRMLEEVVRRAPRVSDPYHTLGLVYEEMEDQKRALECYLIAAYLTGKDVETWKRVATMSKEQGLLHQAIYCINRALRLSPGDVSAQYTRAAVLVDLGQTKKGSEAYKALLKIRPHDATVAAEIARLYSKNNESTQAIKVLHDCLHQNIALGNGETKDTAKEKDRAANNALVPVPLKASSKGELLGEDDDPEEIREDPRPIENFDPAPYLHAQLHLCNILAELYMSKGKFAETISMIEDLEKRGACGGEGGTPLDLAVKCGICKVYVGAPGKGPEDQFARLRAEDVLHFADLYFDVAEALLALDSHDRALEFYEPLLKDNAYNQPAIWLKIGRCHLSLCAASNPNAFQGRSGRNSGTALRYYTKVLKAVPNNSEAAVAIASLHVADGKPETALRLLDRVYAQLDLAQVEPPEWFVLPGSPPALPNGEDDQEQEQEQQEETVSYGDESSRGRTKRRDAADVAAAERRAAAPKLASVPTDCGGLQLLVEKARLLYSFGRHEDFLRLVLVHILRAVHALAPPPVEGAAAAAAAVSASGAAALGRKRKSTTGYPEDGIATNPTLADVMTDKAFINLGAKAATIMARDRDYAVANITIQALLRFHGRPSKPVRGKVASTGSAGAVKGTDTVLFKFRTTPDDEADDEPPVLAAAAAAAGSDDTSAGAAAVPSKSGKLMTKEGPAVDKLRLLAVGICYILRDYEKAYENIKIVSGLRPTSTVFWNLYNTISMQCQEADTFDKAHRLLIKLLVSHPDSVPLMMLVGHHCAVTRNLGLAIAEYLRANSLRPKEPLISLCIGTSYLSQVMQKNTYNRHLVCLKAFTFLDQYSQLRLPSYTPRAAGSTDDDDAMEVDEGDERNAEQKLQDNLLAQEISFNMGRAYHQLNLLHLAVPYYEQTLALAEENRLMPRQAAADPTAASSGGEIAGLGREAAYNLFLIYRSQKGSQRLAREILRTHLTI